MNPTIYKDFNNYIKNMDLNVQSCITMLNLIDKIKDVLDMVHVTTDVNKNIILKWQHNETSITIAAILKKYKVCTLAYGHQHCYETDNREKAMKHLFNFMILGYFEDIT